MSSRVRIISTLKAHAFKVTSTRADIGQLFRLILLLIFILLDIETTNLSNHQANR
jgi:hypothetical protein